MHAWNTAESFNPAPFQVAVRDARPSAEGHVAGGWVYSTLILLLLLSFASVILGVFHQKIAGDEFIFLSNVYRAAYDEPLGLLQTAYVHVFGWLTKVEGGEIVQIRLARLIYVAIWGASLALLYRLAGRLMDPLGALAAVVLFALFSPSVANAASFRVDGLLLPLLLAAALFLINPTSRRVAAAGAMAGLALALTVKAVLWAPALAGALAVGLWDSRGRFWPIIAGALATSLSLCGIMLVHSWLISSAATAAPELSSETVSWLGTYMLSGNGFFPKWSVFANSVRENLITWSLLILGLLLTLADLRRPHRRKSALVQLSLALPLVSIAFYTNAFPYAYLILFPTACLLAGRGSSHIANGQGKLRAVSVLACLAAASLPLLMITTYNLTDRQEYQRKIISIIHDLFRTPVHYIDVGGMVSSFPRSIFFMTDFGVIGYRERGEPVIATYIREECPPLLIANRELLEVWNGGAADGLDPQLRFLPEDEEAIRATYAHYWGQIYLAGRQWLDLKAGQVVPFEIAISGDYTLLSEGPVAIDGRASPPGGRLTLAAGPHALRTVVREPDLRILWGKNVKIPSEKPVADFQ